MLSVEPIIKINATFKLMNVRNIRLAFTFYCFAWAMAAQNRTLLTNLVYANRLRDLGLK
jgi:hypothetical protein